MKTFKKYATVLLVVGVLFSTLAYSIESKTVREYDTLRKPLVLSAINFDGNRIDNDLQNNGMIVSHNVSGRSGMTWPKGNGTQTIFASGVWVGAKVGGQIRVTMGEYNGELVGGPYGSDPNDPYHKLYKINRSDWDDPAASDDFQNWPAHQGAPFVDVNENGTYEPLPSGPDYPDFPGDQVVWAVMNDGDPTAHAVMNTPPLGIEVQMTIFGFDRPDAFGDMMFVKELIINRGDDTLNEAIIGLWSDPDLGDAADDFVGCDTTLGVGICYNDGDDVNFAGYVNGTPAVAYDFFQGPMVPMEGETAKMFGREIPDMMNLKMTSFTKYINPDPTYYDPNNAEEAYNYMQGLMADGSEFPFVASGGTKFVHPGDPNLDTGPEDTEYVDSDLHPSDDRRFLMNAGPFTMAPGDSQEVVFGIFHAAAGDALKSYNLIKVVDAQAQFAYDSDFILPGAPDKPVVETTVLEDEVILSWGHESELYSVPGPDTPTGEATTFEFEGYNVYQYETANGTNPVRVATYDVINDVNQIKDEVFVAELEELVETTVQQGTDSGVKRSISISQDYTRQNVPLIENRAYYFGVTAYSYNAWASPKVLESSHNIITVRPQAPQDWAATDETGIYGTVLQADHTEGPSDGVAQATVIDPTQVTGDDYEMFFTTETYYRDVDGIWKNQNPGGKEALQRILDCSGSIITVSALASETVGTYDLTFDLEMHCGGNWIDGILLEFTDDISINSWGPVGDCSNGGGQNCGNMDGTYNAATNSILWGNDARSEWGATEQDAHWTVNIDPIDLADFPIDVAYTIYDDGWDGTIVDGAGTASATELGYATVDIDGWYARNTNTGEIITPHTTIQSGVSTDNIIDGIYVPGSEVGPNAGPIAEGLQFAVDGPELGILAIEEYGADDDALIDGTVDSHLHPSLSQTGLILDNRAGDINLPAYNRDYDRFDYWGMDDVYFNFSETSLAWDYLSETVNAEVPFSVYRTDFASGETYRMFAGYWESGGDLGWDVHDAWETPTFHAPSFEPIYCWQGFDAGGNPINYDPANEAQYLADNSLLTSANQTWGGGTGVFHYPYITATMFGAYYGLNAPGDFTGSADGGVSALPIAGNYDKTGAQLTQSHYFKFTTAKANTAADKFTVSTADVTGVAATYDVDNINVWPNPYFGFNPEERDPVDQQIHFTGLPVDSDCTIRIFDLAGVPVKTINHDAGSSLEIWNTKNDSNIPVASGMYIAVVETNSGTKILKIAVIQPEQRIDIYG